MKRLFHRGARLATTFVVITTVTCVVVLHGDRSFSHFMAMTLTADVGAVGLAMVINDRPWKRRNKSKGQPMRDWSHQA